jgi:glycosyltransferase involved in cell wall biosynthesis
MTKESSEKRIKILFIIDKWQAGGRQRVLQQLINALDSNAFEPILLILSKPSPSFPLPNSRVITLPSMRYRAYILPIIRIVRTERPLIISPHLGVLAAPIIWMAVVVSRTRAAVIYTIQSIFDVASYKQTAFPRLNKYLISRSLKAAASITTASEGMRVPLSKEFDLPTNMMLRAPHLAYSAAEYSGREHVPMDGGVRILSVGRFAYPKDFSTVLRAFKKAQQMSSTPLILSLIGSGQDENELRKEARDLGLDESIFKGAMTVDRATFSATDIFIFSSRSEGMPVVLIEALAAGIPVIATDCDFGPRELIRDGSSGFLVPVGDIEAMAHAIVRLSGDPALMNSFAKAAPSAVRAFEINNAVQEWGKIFAAAIGREYPLVNRERQ